MSEWEHYQPLTETITFVDGTSKRGSNVVMRRRLPDGGWEYRLPTEEEARLWLSFDAW